MNVIPFLLAPVICAGIGWFTNYLAVKMLFHPRQPVRLPLLTIQGVFPKRKSALAANLGDVIERELICAGDISTLLRDPALAGRLHGQLDAYVEKLLTKDLTKAVPMAAMFLNGPTLVKIKEVLVPELERFVPELLTKASSELEANLDVSRHVRERIENFSMDKLEEVLFAIMRKEFRFIEMVGGVLGFAIGLFQSALFALVG